MKATGKIKKTKTKRGSWDQMDKTRKQGMRTGGKGTSKPKKPK
jgi:hypothetical protein